MEKRELGQASRARRWSPHWSKALLALLGREPRHAYGLFRSLVSSGFEIGDPALVYHYLHDLERTALVRSRWDMSGPGPARRVYSLTAGGRGVLDAGGPDGQFAVTGGRSGPGRAGPTEQEERCDLGR